MRFFGLLSLVFLRSIFGEKWSRIALNKLFFDFTYRIPLNLKGKFKSVFVFSKISLKLLWSSADKAQSSFSSEVVYYDYNSNKDSAIRDYFKNVFNEQPEYGVFRDSLPNHLHVFEKIIITLFLVLNSCFSIVFIAIKRNINLAFLGLELIENSILLKFLTKNKVKKVLLLSAYERDITLLCYILRMIEIKTELFPSPNPLKLFYKYVYADKIWLSAPFQLNEAKELSVNWSVREYGQIPPFDFQLINKFKTGLTYLYKIGIISSGIAFRKKHGIELGDENDYLAELKLYDIMKRILESGKVKKDEFVIFLHPKEKNKNDTDEIVEYYKSIFGFKVNFCPIDTPAIKCFNLCEVAIATISTAQIERLFGGYKSVFASLSSLKSPFSDERLQKISANSYEELISLVDNVLGKSEEDFFKDYNLEDYHYSKFKNLPMNSVYSFSV
jgi:hypothetical protein